MGSYSDMVNDDIKKLAYEVLGKEEIDNIHHIIHELTGGNREKVINELIDFVGVKPKRPLYYVAMHIKYLPEHGTRDVIRDLGDYIDQFVKFTLEDKKFLARWYRKPLGPNLEKLKKYIDIDFYQQLKLFNIIYTQAKHDYNHYEDKSWFNYQDVVYMVFITKKLAPKLLAISERARDYNNEGKTFYRYQQID